MTVFTYYPLTTGNMSHFKQFLDAIKNSFYNPEFYKQVPHKRFSKIVLLYFGLIIIPVCVIVSQILIVAIPAVHTFSNNEFIDQYYPEGLELTANDNVFSSNVEEPFSIPLAEEMKKENSTFKNLIVIDTKQDLTLDQIRNHEAVIVVVRDGIVIHKEGGELETISLKESELGNFIISEPQVNIWADTILKVVKIFIVPVVIFLTIFVWIMAVVLNLFFALFAGLIVKLIMYIKKTPIDFKGAYKIALFALIPGFVVNIFLAPLFTSLPFVIDLALFLLIVLLNLKNTGMKHSEEVSTV